MYFQYSEKEINYLCEKDTKLKEVIEKLGHIDREVDPDIFSSIIHHIIGQQISTKAQETIYRRVNDLLKDVTAENILQCSDEALQKCGLTFKKVEWMKDVSRKIVDQEYDLDAIKEMSDAEAIQYLSSLKGIGVWTAEMILLFSLQRKDIFAYDDLIIQKGLRMIYHHRKITRSLFEKYRRRFSPYCSVASLYIWTVGNGKLEGYKDYAPKRK